LLELENELFMQYNHLFREITQTLKNTHKIVEKAFFKE
jgi:hypothetical protein